MTRDSEHRIRRADEVELAARFSPGRGPTIVFLPGLRSDMAGDKASRLAATAEARGQAVLRLDYSGHGSSGGRFVDGSVAVWRDDALLVMERLIPEGPVLLVGSSMGGWIGLMAALALGPRCCGFVGIAAAPDFTRQMRAALTPEQTASLDRDGLIMLPALPDPLPLTQRALADGDRCCLLDGPIPLRCPVRLLHGQADDVVPWQVSVSVAEKVETPDCRILLVKDGDHRLSRPQDLLLLQSVVDELSADSTARSPSL